MAEALALTAIALVGIQFIVIGMLLRAMHKMQDELKKDNLFIIRQMAENTIPVHELRLEARRLRRDVDKVLRHEIKLPSPPESASNPIRVSPQFTRTKDSK